MRDTYGMKSNISDDEDFIFEGKTVPEKSYLKLWINKIKNIQRVFIRVTQIRKRSELEFVSWTSPDSLAYRDKWV